MHKQLSSREVALEDSGGNLRFLAALVANCNLKPGSCVLEIGCGTGVLGQSLSAVTGARVFGTEINPVAWAEANKRIEALHVADGEIPNGRLYDLVYCKDVLPMVRDKRGLLSAVRKVLKIGGEFITYIPTAVDFEEKPLYAFIPGSEVRSKASYGSVSSLIELLKDTGFSTVCTERIFLGPVTLNTQYALKHADGFFNNTDQSALESQRNEGVKKMQGLATDCARYGAILSYDWERTLVIAK
jgi:SAM-dependent methyltransferase